MKKSTVDSPFISLGASALLVTFIILCLVSFATLSLSSAHNDYTFTSRMAERKTQYYRASNQAEEILHTIDAALAEGKPAPADGTELAGISLTAADDEILFQVPMNDSQALQVALQLTPGENTEYTIKTWQIANTASWEANDTVTLLPMGQ